MKADIHPEYNKIKAVCACGAEFELGSVEEEVKVEICSACHPFFTGKQKLVDTAGRIEKIQKEIRKTFRKATGLSLPVWGFIPTNTDMEVCSMFMLWTFFV